MNKPKYIPRRYSIKVIVNCRDITKVWTMLYLRFNLIAITFCMVVSFCTLRVSAQKQMGSVIGSVADELGGLVIDAQVSLQDESSEIEVRSGSLGEFAFRKLRPGKYKLTVMAAGFAIYQEDDIEVRIGHDVRKNIKLIVALEKEDVTVDESKLSTSPDRNADSLILRRDDLAALPDDPQSFAAILQALAGSQINNSNQSGLGGQTQITVDGFSNGRIPRKHPSAKSA